jgi:hypothetical protein
LTQLQAAEKIGITAVNAAEAAYNASVRSRAPVTQTAALDPGRHQVALGAIRTAIGHVESIMAAVADAQEKGSAVVPTAPASVPLAVLPPAPLGNLPGGTPSKAVGTDGTIDKLPASRATALPTPTA